MIINPANRLQQVEEYYFSKKLAQIKQMQAQGINVINLGIGSPDLMPSPKTIKALSSTAKLPTSHGYQSYTGIPQLRQSISNWYLKTYKVSLNPHSEILPLMGSKEGIMHLHLAFINPSDAVLIPNPGYPTYSSSANLVQAKIIPYTLNNKNNWQPNLNNLQQILNTQAVKIMWINYPNMPTGANATLNQLEKIVKFAHKNKILLINDNPYSLILNPKPSSILQIDGAKEVALELNSLSKSHNLAGWRVGMLCGESNYISTVLKVKSNMDSGMFLGIQQAAINALQNSQQWHKAQNTIYAKRKQIACKILNALNCTYSQNQVGMFVWAKAPKSIPNVSHWIENILTQLHIFITPGFIFGTQGNQYLRISLCNTEQKLEEALTRIKEHPIA